MQDATFTALQARAVRRMGSPTLRVPELTGSHRRRDDAGVGHIETEAVVRTLLVRYAKGAVYRTPITAVRYGAPVPSQPAMVST